MPLAARFPAIAAAASLLLVAAAGATEDPEVEISEAPAASYKLVDCPATFTLVYELEPIWTAYELRRHRCRGFEDLSFTALRIEAPTRRLPAKATLYMTLDWGHDKLVRAKLTLLGDDDRRLYERPVRAEIEEGRSKGQTIRLPDVRQELIEQVRKVALRVDSIEDD